MTISLHLSGPRLSPPLTAEANRLKLLCRYSLTIAKYVDWACGALPIDPTAHLLAQGWVSLGRPGPFDAQDVHPQF